GLPPAAGQRRFITNVETFARIVEGSRAAIATLDHADVGLAPHSLRAVTPDELAAIIELANLADAGAQIHIHVAEQVKEVDDCLAWSGARPVGWLLDHAPVDSRWCVIHGTHATEDELRALARRGATTGLCPITEGSLGDGVFGARTFLTH